MLASPTSAPPTADPGKDAVLIAYKAYTQVKVDMYDKATFDGDMRRWSWPGVPLFSRESATKEPAVGGIAAIGISCKSKLTGATR